MHLASISYLFCPVYTALLPGLFPIVPFGLVVLLLWLLPFFPFIALLPTVLSLCFLSLPVPATLSTCEPPVLNAPAWIHRCPANFLLCRLPVHLDASAHSQAASLSSDSC